MKAIVFDNSGTLIERYRVIKDVFNGEIFTNINSLDLIDSADALALVVLQFNTNKLLDLDPNTLISRVIKDYDIDFDVSFSNRQVSKAEVKEILDNETSTTVSDITDGFGILGEKIPHFELCNGSALIVDMDLGQVAYTITSAGKFFPRVFETIETLKSRGIEIYIASGVGKAQSIVWQACLTFPRTMPTVRFQHVENVRSYQFSRMLAIRS